MPVRFDIKCCFLLGTKSQEAKQRLSVWSWLLAGPCSREGVVSVTSGCSQALCSSSWAGSGVMVV